MKLLHLLHGYPPEFFGGTELYVQALARAQVAAGHEVVVLCGTNRSGPTGRDASLEDGVPVHRLRRSWAFHERWDHGSSPEVAKLVREVLTEEGPDLVHVHHWSRLTRELVRLARTEGVPVVASLHDLYASCPRIFRVREGEAFCERPLSPTSCLDCVPREPWMSDDLVAQGIRWFASDLHAELEAADLRLVPSAAHARQLARHTGFAEADFVVEPHGSILTWPPRAPAAAWTGDRPLRVAHWGHLQAIKGVHVLAEALRTLPRSEDVELLLWGPVQDEAYGRDLDARLKGLVVERREAFDRDDLRDLEADLAVFPTMAHESWSFVLDEAFALGLPVLGSDRGALPERIGAAGRCFPAGAHRALARLLTEVLEAPALLAEMRRELPAPVPMVEHERRLAARYAAVREAGPGQAPPGVQPAELVRWERIAQLLERRARSLAGLREKAESELANLRRSHEELSGSVAEYEASLTDQRQDLLNHRARVGELERDLEAHRRRLASIEEDLGAHRKELERARADYAAAEQGLLEERATRERRDAELAEAWGELERTKAELAGHAAELTRLREAVDDLESRRGILAAELEESRKTQEELTRTVAARDDELREAAKSYGALEAYATRLRRENRLALPLVWPARLLLAVKDRFFGKPGGKRE
ncbi:MAG: glycosyltransferase [Planctomycetota bacterium]